MSDDLASDPQHEENEPGPSALVELIDDVLAGRASARDAFPKILDSVERLPLPRWLLLSDQLGEAVVHVCEHIASIDPQNDEGRSSFDGELVALIFARRDQLEYTRAAHLKGVASMPAGLSILGLSIGLAISTGLLGVTYAVLVMTYALIVVSAILYQITIAGGALTRLSQWNAILSQLRLLNERGS